MKTCTKCKIEKELDGFCKDKYTKDGLYFSCKDCNKEYRENNKDKCKEYYEINKDKILLNKKEYYETNKDKIKDYNKINKEKTNLRIKNRRKEDIQFKLSDNLRTRLRSALRNNQKVGSAVSDLGCSINDLKLWLEDQFKDGMTWDNYGNKDHQWSIDHIIPLSKVDLTNREDLLKVCNYTNLQPLWHLDNMKKGNKLRIY